MSACNFLKFGAMCAFLAPMTSTVGAQWQMSNKLNSSETDVKNAQVAADPVSGFHILYANANPWQIVYRRYRDGYLTPRSVVHTQFVPNPMIAVGGQEITAGSPDADVHLVWENWSDTPQCGWSMSGDNGGSFTVPAEITAVRDVKYPLISHFGASNGREMIMSFWKADSKELLYRRWNGSSWGPLGSLGTTADNEYCVTGLCRSLQDGTVYRAYGRSVGGVTSYCYKRFTDVGWGPEVVVASTGFFARQDIAVSPSGLVMCVWEQDSHLYYRLYTPGSGWSGWSQSNPAAGDLGTAHFAALVAVPGGNDFYLTYADGTQKRCMGRRFSGGGWLPAELVSIGLPDNFVPDTAVAAAPDGTLFACWEYWGTDKPQWWYSVRPGTGGATGTIAGVVRDQFGAGISGAAVGTGAYATVSGSGGSYALGVQAGTHTVSANKDYYTGSSIPGIAVAAGQVVPLDLVITANPPGAVTGFQAVSSEAVNRLSWLNPTSGNYYATRVLVKAVGFPSNPADGTVIFDQTASPGSAGSFMHSGLTNGTPYYYAAYARDPDGHWSSSNRASGQPHTLSCGEARLLPDASVVDLNGKIVLAVFSSDGAFYIGEPDRSAGIRVTGPLTGLAVGKIVNLTGTMATRYLSSCPAERYVAVGAAPISVISTAPSPRPLAVNSSNLGGEPVVPFLPGVKDAVGLNNIGSLVRHAGRVTAKLGQNFWVDDGGAVTDPGGRIGVMVKSLDTTIPVATGDLVLVTGIAEGSIASGQTTNRRMIHVRDENADILILQPAGSAP